MGFIILGVVSAIAVIVIGLMIISLTTDYHISFAILVGWGMVMILLALIPTFVEFETTEVKVGETEIMALKDNTNTEGNIFLGSGSISGVDYYYYMVDGEKGFAMNKVRVDSSHIKEVEDGEYKLETYKLEVKSDLTKWFYETIMEDEHEYIFHVPKGSVDKNFKVDME